jgi:hypothetical protein
MALKLTPNPRGLVLFTVCLILLTAAFNLTPVGAQATSNQMVLDLGSHSWDEFVWRPSVTYQDPVFTMWYTGQDAGGANNVGVASSTDGLAWAKYDGNPVLTVGPAGAWDSGSVQEPWVIYDGSSYRMWYTGERYDSQGAVVSVAIGYATSTDGLHWAKFSGNPVLSPGASGTWDDQWVFRPTVIFTGSSYTMYYQGKSSQSDVFQIGRATSTNGTGWVKTAQPMVIQQSGWNAYSTFIGGSYKLADQYVMLIYGAGSSAEPNKIGFAKSPDGTTWTTYAASIVSYGDAGTWDDAGVILPFLVIARGNYYVYYTGVQRDVGSRIGVSIMPTSAYPIPEFPTTALITTFSILTGMLLIARRKLRRHRTA